MRYFELRQSEQLCNPIKIIFARDGIYKYNPTKDEFENYPSLHVGYYKYEETVEIPEVLEGVTLFVGDAVKAVLKMYDETIPFKGIDVYPLGMAEKIIPSYWTFFPKESACLHSSVKIMPNGTLEELILDSKTIPDENIFKVAGTKLHRVVVTLPVAESLLRRKMFGISLREVEVI